MAEAKIQNYNITNNSHVPYDFFTRGTRLKVRVPPGESVVVALDPSQVEKLSTIETLNFQVAPEGALVKPSKPKPIVSVREVGQRKFAIYDDNERRPEAYGTREEAEAKSKAPVQPKQATALDAAKTKASADSGLKSIPQRTPSP